jgi:hypothetical protein
VEVWNSTVAASQLRNTSAIVRASQNFELIARTQLWLKPPVYFQKNHQRLCVITGNKYSHILTEPLKNIWAHDPYFNYIFLLIHIPSITPDSPSSTTGGVLLR